MPTIGFVPTPSPDAERDPPNRANGVGPPVAAWADGVFVFPLLWLAVMGYQAVVLMLKVLNRERPSGG